MRLRSIVEWAPIVFDLVPTLGDGEDRDQTASGVRLSIPLAFQSAIVKGSDNESSGITVGCSAVQVMLKAERGSLAGATRGAAVASETTVTSGGERSIEAKPELKVLAAGGMELKGGGVTLKRETSSEVTYLHEEYPLDVFETDSYVRWEIKMPRGSRATRDYLFGGYRVAATLLWRGAMFVGTLRVRARRWKFYDAEDREFGPLRSAAMLARCRRYPDRWPGWSGWSYELEVMDP